MYIIENWLIIIRKNIRIVKFTIKQFNFRNKKKSWNNNVIEYWY